MVGWFSGMVNLMFPPRCVGCAFYGEWWCSVCDRQILRSGKVVCPSELDEIICVADYKTPLQQAIQALKYRHAKIIAAILADKVDLSKLPEDVVLVPVPLHVKRLRERGHNQSELFARHLAARSGIPMHVGLTRIRNTPSQTSLTRSERHRNVHGAFQWKGKAPGTVLLIDDVLTTGATFNACARACREAGANQVYGLAIAKR